MALRWMRNGRLTRCCRSRCQHCSSVGSSCEDHHRRVGSHFNCHAISSWKWHLRPLRSSPSPRYRQADLLWTPRASATFHGKPRFRIHTGRKRRRHAYRCDGAKRASGPVWVGKQISSQCGRGTKRISSIGNLSAHAKDVGLSRNPGRQGQYCSIHRTHST